MNEASSIAAVNERIHGVEYIFLDEVSMVSCNDLQILASQAAKARNIHDIEFGGLNIVLAGDFAQLPPTGGPALYADLKAFRLADATSTYMQESILGRILWHEFTTVVILRVLPNFLLDQSVSN